MNNLFYSCIICQKFKKRFSNVNVNVNSIILFLLKKKEEKEKKKKRLIGSLSRNEFPLSDLHNT